MSKEGRKFEEDVYNSSTKQGVMTVRIRDIFIPPELRNRIKTPRNPYDFLFFYKQTLFPIELKSAKGKSFSYDGTNPKIKPHQIKSLTEDQKYEDVECGLVLNFRDVDKTYFIHIDDFNLYRKDNPKKKSIPLRVCEEIGTEITYYKPRTRNHYYMDKLFDELIEKYGSV